MKSLRRALSTLTALAVGFGAVVVAAPAASAAALTNVARSVSNAHPRATNVRYSWNGTTATTGTVSKVTMGMPAGTVGGPRHLALPGTLGNYAGTPNSVAASITGDIDIRAKLSAED